MTFGRRWMVAAVLVPLLVGGCSEDPEPKIAPPPESASTSPTPTEPTKQPWEKRSRRGALAFVDQWLEMFNEAATTGDVDPMLEASLESCETCKNFAGVIEDVHSVGGSFESTGWKVESFSFADPEISDRVSLALGIRQPVETIRRPEMPVERSEAGKVTYQADLAWEEGSWSMAELSYVEG